MLFILFYLSCFFGHGQDYSQYFLNKVIADSLIQSGRYDRALPHLRRCAAVPEMLTMTDEFNLGYALFKAGDIDSADFFLFKALNEGFFFEKTEYVDYWEDGGVFEKFARYKSLKPVQDLLMQNTIAYIDSRPLDPALEKELIAAGALDQKYRTGHLTDSSWVQQMALDKQNQKLLRDIIHQHGWPGKKLVGPHGSNAAFLIAQHSDVDTTFQRECLHHIRKAFHQHDVNPADYAYIIDRVRINARRPQLFGTQFYSQVQNGKTVLKLKPVEDERHLNLRRKVFGLPPVDQYLHSSQQRLLK